MRLSLLLEKYREFKLFWESYLSTTEAKITGPSGTIFWILSSIWISELAIAAFAIHVLPLGHHYLQNRPFGIEFIFAPVRTQGGDPDLLAADDGEAILQNGSCTIFATVRVSESLTSYELRFETGGNVAVELRDIPKREQVYQKDRNILSTESVISNRFQLVLDLFDCSQRDTERGFLEIKDHTSGVTIERIELIRT